MPLLQQIKVPLISVNDTSLTVVEILYETGKKVSTGDIILIFETSKTTYDVNAETDGFIEYKCKAGNDYELNDVVANIYSEASEIKTQKLLLDGVKNLEVKSVIKETAWIGEPIYSQEAIELIEKNGFDKHVFANKDFVSKLDVEEQFGLHSGKELISFKAKQPTPAKNKTAEVIGNVTLQKLSSNKKKEIKYLSAVQSAGLISTINTTVDTEGIFFQVNKSLKYFKNSLLPIIVYESSRLLKKFPLLNSFFNDDNIAEYNHVNIGFAIDAGKGLKVVKIQDSNTKSISEIESKILSLSELYLDDRLTIDNLSEVTFTITDLSSEDVSFFQPLINMQNGAILGISAIDEKLNRCILSLSFDHRVTEGKQVAKFLKELKERLASYQILGIKDSIALISCYRCHKMLSEDLSGVGFAKCITSKGHEGYICQSCFKGF